MVTTNNKTLDVVQGAVDVLNTELPGLLLAYDALKTIWTAFDPTMDEPAYKARLRSLSSDGGAFTSAWLVAHGYVQDASGNWSKPAPPAAAPAAPGA